MQRKFVIEDYTYHAVWPDPPEEIRRKVRSFWIRQNIIPPASALEQRLQELLVVVESPDGHIQCVSSASVALAPRIKEPMYHFRAMTSPELRHRQLSSNMLNLAFDYLQDYNHQMASPEASGIFVQVENAGLMKTQNHAIWIATRCVFIGTSSQGWHQRVRYFEASKISPDQGRQAPLSGRVTDGKPL